MGADLIGYTALTPSVLRDAEIQELDDFVEMFGKQFSMGEYATEEQSIKVLETFMNISLGKYKGEEVPPLATYILETSLYLHDYAIEELNVDGWDPTFKTIRNPESYDDIWDELDVLWNVLIEFKSLEYDIGSFFGNRMARDAVLRSYRIKGREYQFFFAGEMSWGDEPRGTGYELLRDLHRTGILECIEEMCD